MTECQQFPKMTWQIEPRISAYTCSTVPHSFTGLRLFCCGGLYGTSFPSTKLTKPALSAKEFVSSWHHSPFFSPLLFLFFFLFVSFLFDCAWVFLFCIFVDLLFVTFSKTRSLTHASLKIPCATLSTDLWTHTADYIADGRCCCTSSAFVCARTVCMLLAIVGGWGFTVCGHNRRDRRRAQAAVGAPESAIS